MALRVALLLIFLCWAAADANNKAGTASVAAVEKVIQMLRDMATAGKQEKNDEEIAFAKFSKWCEMEQAKLKKNIADAKEAADSLAASITKLTSDAKALGEEIDQLTADVVVFEADKKSAEEQREKDHAAYLEEVKDYGESVDALERAINVLQAQNYDRTGKESPKEVLMQLSNTVDLPPTVQSFVTSFLGVMQDPEGEETAETAPDYMSYEAPEANAYEFQSTSIIEVLKNLLAEFTKKKGDCEKEEMNGQHAHNLVVQDLVDSIENAKDDITRKSKEKAEKLAEAAADKEELDATLKELAEDEATLKAMTTECEEKTLSFNEKQKLRVEEIEAIEKAIEILSSEEVLGAAGTYLDLAQKGAASLLQINRRQGSAVEAKAQGIRTKLREFVTSEAHRLKSRTLTLLAERLAADPFAKVKKLIDAMITRLLNEANQDAQREGWCDTELGKSKVTRNKLNEDIDGLTAAIDEGKATIAKLTEEIATLQKEIADLQVAMTEATKIREEEKAKNKQTIADAQAAQKAVLAATKILQDFYDRAGKATAFVQQGDQRPTMGSEEWKALANPNYEAKTETVEGTVKVDKGHKEGMQTFGETYKGQQDESGPVLGLLEVILSDFAHLEAETEAAEAESQHAYEEFMADAKQNVAVKTRKVEMDTEDKKAAEAKLQTDIKDLKMTQDELLAADRYHATLVPQCIDQGVTFEERTAQREAEIASLREALKILSSPDIATSAL